ncbi:hypothetical protein [Pseudoteredinibacter isoporae]|uniref:Uncharacterized protein n=1 Tax=Pseudoteredinibacter isoporae TaxID=570281 RepID=A0A7X0JYX7_9GAMM|nr:hypothetical protein [Pseudoteredinibacter isoporae]MBB6523851.1 hypothetical protein [Pseudoteredinibacter isoporae]NHO89368.1 hypothetical protein [Pseudoteredinibacter isoporae]NIB22475.1 hypothetical protein [Pseudoteredinibacter isoporae]
MDGEIVAKAVEDYIRRTRPYRFLIVAIPLLLCIPLILYILFHFYKHGVDLQLLAPGGTVVLIMGFTSRELKLINVCVGQAAFLPLQMSLAASKEEKLAVLRGISCINLQEVLFVNGGDEAR